MQGTLVQSLVRERDSICHNWTVCMLQLPLLRPGAAKYVRPHELQHLRLPWPSPFPSLLKLMSTESVMPTNHLILCCPLLHSVFPSIRVFSNVLSLIRWLKCCSFSISPSNEYSGLISFRTEWFDFLAVSGTLKSLVQHHSLKVSILRQNASFMVQVSHSYMTTGKTMALTI